MIVIHALATALHFYMIIPGYLALMAHSAYTWWVNAMHTDWLWGALVADACWLSVCLIAAGRNAVK